MKKERNYYIDSDNPDKVLWGLSWRAIVIGIVLILLCAGANWFTWGIKVFTSDIRGAGNAQIQINSAENRIQSQERFEALYATIVGMDKNIDVLYAAMVRNPGDKFHETNYIGAVNICNTTVQTYNAEARKVSSTPWKSADLPWEIDQSSPSFDCKESAK